MSITDGSSIDCLISICWINILSVCVIHGFVYSNYITMSTIRLRNENRRFIDNIIQIKRISHDIVVRISLILIRYLFGSLIIIFLFLNDVSESTDMRPINCEYIHMPGWMFLIILSLTMNMSMDIDKRRTNHLRLMGKEIVIIEKRRSNMSKSQIIEIEIIGKYIMISSDEYLIFTSKRFDIRYGILLHLIRYFIWSMESLIQHISQEDKDTIISSNLLLFLDDLLYVGFRFHNNLGLIIIIPNKVKISSYCDFIIRDISQLMNDDSIALMYSRLIAIERGYSFKEVMSSQLSQLSVATSLY